MSLTGIVLQSKIARFFNFRILGESISPVLSLIEV